MNFTSFFTELKRRNVIRAAGLYLVGAWLLIQVASTMLPAFDAPTWVLRSLIITLAVCFVPALIFSWVFELTPQGLKRDDEVPPEQSIGPQTGRRMDRLIIVVLVLALGYFCFDKFVLTPRREAAMMATATAPNERKSGIPEKSIAVLPFENLSSDKDNAYFAEGIQDEILTRLSKIATLKVISRTSTQKYRSAPDNLREVGRELGAANLLEGSVQKITNAVHVNVQLIRAATDEHLWAVSYNRKLDDVFGVEGEVATAIADQLNAKLTGGEKAILTTKPTTNPQAYDDYLRGLTQSRHFSEASLEAAASFGKAVREDPQFALGWATLSRMDALIYFKFLDRSPARREAARQALAEALRLQPDLLETQMARAYFQYWVLLDYRGARDMIEQLRAKWPGNSEIVKVLGWISARLGDWQKSADYLDQAIELNPRDVFLRTTAALDRLNSRDPSAALRMANDALAIEPDDGTLLALKAAVFQSLGELDQAQPIVERLNPNDPNQLNTIAYQAKLRRKPSSALHYFQSTPTESATQPAQIGNLLLLADLLDSAGDQAKARAIDAQVRAVAEAALKAQPNNAGLLAFRAYALAGLGDRVAALDELDRCIALQAEDALDKGSLEEIKARALARFGQKDEAIALLQHLLSISYNFPVTPALLRLDPDWDNLCGDPRFEKLAVQPLPKTK